jgi:arabinogalactan oligomer/maltooligosaccharide transport system permease protein
VRHLESFAAHALAVVATMFALYPLLWVLGLALSPDGLSSNAGLWPLPAAPSLANARAVVGGNAHFWTQLANSLIVSGATATVAIVLALPAAYALARFSFLGAKAGLRTMLWTQMFPGVASAVPLYVILDKLGLLDSRAGLVLVYATTAIPFALLQLKGAFEGIPIELEEAAWVDGASRVRTFLTIVLPAARPAIAVTFLFAFMSAWNEFILAATLLSRESAFTLPVVLQRLVGEHAAQWGVFAAGALIVSVPVVALFYVAQKSLVAGLTAGGVKG